MPNITNDNLTGKDVMLDIGLSDSDSKLLNQLMDLMGQLLPMVKETTDALGKVMSTSHESFSSVRSDLDTHSETAKQVTEVQLDMRDAVSDTAKGIDLLASSTAKLTEAMEKYAGTAKSASKASRRVKQAAQDEDLDYEDDDEEGGGSLMSAERRAGSVRGTRGVIENILKRSGGAELKSIIGNTLGGGAVGSTVTEALSGALKGAGNAALPIMAVMAGMKGIESAVQLEQKYRSVIGTTNLGEAAGYEAKARMMSLSPWLSGEQSHQIVMGTLKAGYGGVQANTVMDFVAKNVKSGVLDINESIAMYKDAVGKAGGSVDAVSLRLERLEQVAADTGASVEGLMKSFSAGQSTLTASGAQGLLATGVAGLLGETLGDSGLTGYNPAAFLGTEYGMSQVGRMLGPGINSTNFYSEIAKRGITDLQVSKATTDYYRSIIQRWFGSAVQPGMTLEDLQMVDTMRMRSFGRYLVQMGIVDASLGNDVGYVMKWILWAMGADPQAVYNDMMGDKGPKSLDTVIPLSFRPDITAREMLERKLDDIDSLAPDMNTRIVKSAAASAQLESGAYLPYVQDWLNDWGTEAIVEVDGKAVYLSDYLKKMPASQRNQFMRDVFDGKYRLARGKKKFNGFGALDQDLLKDPSKLDWQEGGIAGIEGVTPDALDPSKATQVGDVRITLDPAAARILRIAMGDQIAPYYYGPNQDGVFNSGPYGYYRG